MIHLLNKEISDCTIALRQPNKAIDNYRCYWEGRQSLAKELLLKLQQTPCSTHVCPDCSGTGDLSGKSQNMYEECLTCRGSGQIA